jgi:hypothetical protein
MLKDSWQCSDEERLRMSITKNGLLQASKHIFWWIGKVLFTLFLSGICAVAFWFLRAEVAHFANVSYKAYVIWLDTAIFGVVPSLWIQQNCRSDILDNFFRWVWFTYLYALIFGASFLLILKGEVKRYVISIMITLFVGLIIHYLLPTQPPWMSVNGVIRINGDIYTLADRNLVAAMPSIHQAIICVMGCALWKYNLYGKLFVIAHNLSMTIAIVYLGEHFVVDSIAGVLIALVSWYLAEKILALFDLYW